MVIFILQFDTVRKRDHTLTVSNVFGEMPLYLNIKGLVHIPVLCFQAIDRNYSYEVSFTL